MAQAARELAFPSRRARARDMRALGYVSAIDSIDELTMAMDRTGPRWVHLPLKAEQWTRALGPPLACPGRLPRRGSWSGSACCIQWLSRRRSSPPCQARSATSPAPRLRALGSPAKRMPAPGATQGVICTRCILPRSHRVHLQHAAKPIGRTKLW